MDKDASIFHTLGNIMASISHKTSFKAKAVFYKNRRKSKKYIPPKSDSAPNSDND